MCPTQDAEKTKHRVRTEVILIMESCVERCRSFDFLRLAGAVIFPFSYIGAEICSFFPYRNDIENTFSVQRSANIILMDIEQTAAMSMASL